MQEACRLCMYARVRFTHRGCEIGWMRLRPRVATHTRPCPRQGSLLTERVVADGLCALLFELLGCIWVAGFQVQAGPLRGGVAVRRHGDHGLLGPSTDNRCAKVKAGT